MVAELEPGWGVAPTQGLSGLFEVLGPKTKTMPPFEKVVMNIHKFLNYVIY